MQEWKCAVCGYTHREEDPPEACPVCGAGKTVFTPMVAETAVETVQEKPEPASHVSASRWRCTVCGYVHAGMEPPETCPVCGADRSAFEPVAEEADRPEPKTEKGKAAKAEDAYGESPRLNPKIHPKQWMDEQILLHHAHPISVHIPNGVLPIAVFFVLIGVLFNAEAFKLAAYFNLSMVFLALPLVIYTGFVEWRDRYRASMTPVFRIKIACAAVTAVCVAILVVWRSFSTEAGGVFYVLLHLVALGAAGIAGHLGGKLVFGKRS